MSEDNIEAMEVVSVYRFKQMGLSLSEMGYPQPLDSVMAEDLLYFENCLNEKRARDMKR